MLACFFCVYCVGTFGAFIHVGSLIIDTDKRDVFTGKSLEQLIKECWHKGEAYKLGVIASEGRTWPTVDVASSDGLSLLRLIRSRRLAQNVRSAIAQVCIFDVFNPSGMLFAPELFRHSLSRAHVVLDEKSTRIVRSCLHDTLTKMCPRVRLSARVLLPPITTVSIDTVEELLAHYDKDTHRLDLSGGGIGRVNELAFDEFARTCPEVQELWLSHNPITRVPQLGQLHDLRVINLSNTCIREVPGQIGKLEKLEELVLDGSLIESLPSEIGCCRSLRVLRANKTLLHELPGAIGRLCQLQELWLNSTQLCQLPEEIGGLASLRALWLMSNEYLEELPSTIGKLGNLEQLILDKTIIMELPEEITQLSKLQVLRLQNTELGRLPVEMKKLRELQGLWLENTLVVNRPNWPELRKDLMFGLPNLAWCTPSYA